MTGVPPRMTIVGLGLMGGSLARALRELPAPPAVHGVDRDEATRRAALDARVVESASATLENAPASDLLVLATPVAATIALLADGTSFDRHTLITDVASVKAPVHVAAEQGGLARRYAGSHPLCGDHRAGFTAARPDLYRGARVYVTTPARAPVLEAVSAFWSALGMNVTEEAAGAHDERIAVTSHLPQAAASTLAAVLAEYGVTPAELGRGGTDTTRIAASDAALWTEILLANRDHLVNPLGRLSALLGELRSALAAGDAAAVGELLEHGARWRRSGH